MRFTLKNLYLYKLYSSRGKCILKKCHLQIQIQFRCCLKWEIATIFEFKSKFYRCKIYYKNVHENYFLVEG
jgi:hypothetical protein